MGREAELNERGNELAVSVCVAPGDSKTAFAFKHFLKVSIIAHQPFRPLKHGSVAFHFC